MVNRDVILEGAQRGCSSLLNLSKTLGGSSSLLTATLLEILLKLFYFAQDLKIYSNKCLHYNTML